MRRGVTDAAISVLRGFLPRGSPVAEEPGAFSDGRPLGIIVIRTDAAAPMPTSLVRLVKLGGPQTPQHFLRVPAVVAG
jgi:hypothetical protein